MLINTRILKCACSCRTHDSTFLCSSPLFRHFLYHPLNPEEEVFCVCGVCTAEREAASGRHLALQRLFKNYDWRRVDSADGSSSHSAFNCCSSKETDGGGEVNECEGTSFPCPDNSSSRELNVVSFSLILSTLNATWRTPYKVQKHELRHVVASFNIHLSVD